jgi:hypothetical protein
MGACLEEMEQRAVFVWAVLIPPFAMRLRRMGRPALFLWAKEEDTPGTDAPFLLLWIEPKAETWLT